MPDADLLARALPWMCLLAIALVLVVRVARGSLSRLDVAASAIAVIVCVVGSLHYDSRSDMTAARHELLLGCLDRGELRSVCDCAGDAVLRRIDRSPERFAALERDMIRRQNAGQGPPALILEAARTCG